MQLRATLGYHQAGEYYFYSAFPSTAHRLGSGSDGDFRSPEAFASLVTAVHEHYHLIQELVQGFSWWRHDARDTFVREAISQFASGAGPVQYPLRVLPSGTQHSMPVDGTDPFFWATKSCLELKNIDIYTLRSEFTRKLLDVEIATEPLLAEFLHHDAYNLTTIDLLECQAAILTELYISRLILERPQHFDRTVTAEMAPLFRLQHMLPEYRRPMNALLRILDLVARMGSRIQTSVPDHPLYGQMEHGVIYMLLAFLADYALHLPPNPLGVLERHPDVSSTQDVYPPLRFLNLLFNYLNLLVVGSKEAKQALTTEKLYYTEAPPLLADAVNRMHQNPRGNKAVRTFLTIDQTTVLWEQYSAAKPEMPYPEIARVRRKALQYRRRSPGFWLELEPAAFDVLVEMPVLVLSRTGFAAAPYILDEHLSSIPEADKQAFLSRAFQPHFKSMAGGPWEADPDIPATSFPERFVLEGVKRETTERLARAVLFTGEFRCPLTETIGGTVPCPSRTPACETVVNIGGLPESGCLSREILNQSFGGAARFSRKQ